MRALLPALLIVLALPASLPSAVAACTAILPGVALCDQDDNGAPETLLVEQGAWTPLGGAGVAQHARAGWRAGGADASVGGAYQTRAHQAPDVGASSGAGCSVETAAPYGCGGAGAFLDVATLGRWTHVGAARDGSLGAGATTYGDTTIDVVSAHASLTCEWFSPTGDGCRRLAGSAGVAAYGSSRVYELTWGPRPDPVLCVSGPDLARTCAPLPP